MTIKTAGYDNTIFYPRWQYISNIVQGQTTKVITQNIHDFTVGQIVSFRVSQPYGMVEINNLSGKVLSITSNQFVVDIDSLGWTNFVNAGIYEKNPAVVVPSASGIIPNSVPIQTTLFDAFDNLPP